MEPSLGENSLSAPSRVTTSHNQEILLSSPGQEVVTHSDGNLMEDHTSSGPYLSSISTYFYML